MLIHKYVWPDNSPERAEIAMPTGAKILHVGAQRNWPCIWAMIDPAEPYEIRKFIGVPTGGECPDHGHVGTVLLHEDTFVLHIFEDRA